MKQRVKKVLKSTLIFAMVLALCGTTLAQAYASYATIKIEHIWVDNAPESGASPEEMMSGEEGIEHKLTSEWLFENPGDDSCRGWSDYRPAPEDRDTRTNTFESLWDDATIREYAQQACEKLGQDAAVGLLDQAETLKQLYSAIPEKPEPVEEPGAEPEMDQYDTQEAYEAARAEWEAQGAAYTQFQELDRQYQEISQDYQDLCEQLLYETYDAWSTEHGNEIFFGGTLTDNFLPNDSANTSLKSEIIFSSLAAETNGSFWTSFLRVLQNPGEYVSLPDADENPDYNSLKDSLSEGDLVGQFFPEGTDIPVWVTDEAVNNMLSAVAKDLIADCETEGEDISGIILGNIYSSSDDFFLHNSPETSARTELWKSNDTKPAELTEQSVERLEAEGWEVNTLKLTIVVIQGGMGTYDANTDWWERNQGDNDDPTSKYKTDYRKTYVSTDNGETWTLVDMVDANGNAVETEAIGEKTDTPAGEGEVIESYLYTYLHIRKEGFTKDKPEPDPTPNPDPIDPNPTPDPDPTDPDPTDPDPENPTEKIPDPDVPLGEPELPQEEPPAEEPPEEIELEDPDVPLADIPETGDISDLWYGAALMIAAGLAVLLYQERRNRKTA